MSRGIVRGLGGLPSAAIGGIAAPSAFPVRRVTPEVAGALVALCVLGALVTAYAMARAGADPPPWVDEVSYADPFLNLADGRGFTSGSWASQPYGQAWASNSPLYGILALPALLALDTSVAVWRGFWCAIHSICCVLLLGALARLGLVRSAPAAFLGGAIMLTSGCIFHLPICGRGVDVACLAVVTLGVAALAAPTVRSRIVGLALAGFLIPWAGIQLVPAVAAVGLCGMLLDWRRTIGVGVVLASGCAVGFLALLVAFAALGVADVFLSQTVFSGFTSVGTIAQSVVLRDSSRLSSERYDVVLGIRKMFAGRPEVMILAIAAVVGPLSAWFALDRRAEARRGLILAGAGLVAVPAAMVIAGRWVEYYHWMAVLPLLVAALAAVPGREGRPARRVGPLLMLSAVAAASVGTSWFVAAWRDAPRKDEIAAEVGRFVARTVGPGDVVLTDDIVYFPARPIVARIYSTHYSGGRLFREIPAAEQAGISLLLLRADRLDEVLGTKIGGDWVECDRAALGSRGWVDVVAFRRRPTP